MKVEYEDLIGKPFEWGAKGPDSYDCFGLAIEMRKRAGKFMPDWLPSVQDRGVLNSIIIDTANKCQFKEIIKPIPFCIVTFMIRPPWVSHLGIMLEDCKRFIHVTKGTRVTINRLDFPGWKTRFNCFYEFAGEVK